MFIPHTVTGVLPYYFLPHTRLWEQEIQRLRALGCHAVLVPIPWTYHSPSQGYHDFSDVRNLPLLFAQIAAAGMWAIPHIGPWMDNTLAGGGLPGWLWRAQETEPDSRGYRQVFIRHLADWWKQLRDVLGELISERTVINPALPDMSVTANTLTQLLVLAQDCGFTMPLGVWHQREQDALIYWVNSDATLSEGPTWPVITLSAQSRAASIHHQDSDADIMLSLLKHSSQSGSGVVLHGAIPTIQWGWWRSPVAGIRSQSTHEAFLADRQRCLQAEIGQAILRDSDPAPECSAIPPGCDVTAWRSAAGTAIHVRNPQPRRQFPQVTLPGGDELLLTEELYVEAHASRFVFAQMPLRGGHLIYSTLDVVLRTEVAGRELWVMRNAHGGEVRLSDDFRVRHSKGAIYTERLIVERETQLSIRFDPGKLASLLLDAPDGPLQILALEPDLSLRVWHLDDTWRQVKLPASVWTLAPDEPARGIVVGPDYVMPDHQVDFRYQVSERGYGYRWGPWKGSNPHTWLAPLIWRTPPAIRLPQLVWETAPGAPEVSSAYDDQLWRRIAPNADLSMESQELDVGFVWYRGHFNGHAHYVELACAHSADVFLNGKHIATLNPAPDFSEPKVKRFALAPHLLREHNSLVVLVEAMGRLVKREPARHGLLHCALDQDQAIAWVYRAGLCGEQRKQGVTGYADWALVPGDAGTDKAVTWHHTSFDLDLPDSIAGHLLLELVDVPVKAYVYLNGLLIYRTGMQAAPVQAIRLPLAMLHRDQPNELLIAQWSRGAAPGMGTARLTVGELFDWQSA